MRTTIAIFSEKCYTIYMEKVTKKRVVIFDCFGVVIKKDVSMVWLKENLDDATILEIRKKYYPDADGGKITGRQLCEILASYSNWKASDIENYFHSLVEIDESVLELISRVKKNNYVVMLSNCFSGFLDGVIEDYELEKLFDKVVVSCACHMVKPNKDIYEHALSFFDGCDGAVMIDDNFVNLEGARNAGIENVVLFSSASQAEEELKKIGVEL